MGICANCGKEIETPFCPFCGTKNELVEMPDTGGDEVDTAAVDEQATDEAAKEVSSNAENVEVASQADELVTTEEATSEEEETKAVEPADSGENQVEDPADAPKTEPKVSAIDKFKALPAGKKKAIGIGAGVVVVVLIIAILFGTHVICFHQWEEATCTEPETCAICGRTQGEPLGHDWQDATCTEPQTCSRCGKTSGSPLGHEVAKWTVDKETTCTEEGSRSGTCTVCGETVTESIPVIDHTPGDWEVIEQSGVDDMGKVYKGTRTRKCTVCGAALGTEEYSISEEEAIEIYKASCEQFTYDEVSRDPFAYDGRRAVFRGKVLQVIEGSGVYNYTLLVEVTEGNYGIWNDTVYVEYSSPADAPRILEDDIITMYGLMGGTETYTTVLGASKTVPFMLAIFIE